jgi:hypothetical protein
MTSLFVQCFRSRIASAVCLAVALAALLLPADGLGIPLCQFRAMTHLPCFGCGLTRSFIAMAHLDPGRAAFLHPVGLLLFPLVLGLGALLPARDTLRERLASWAEKRPLVWNLYAGVVLAVFTLYGFGRIVWLLRTHRPSPW